MNLLSDLMTRIRGGDISIFHQYQKPPYGGGNQFLLALRGEFQRRGLSVDTNRVKPRTRACIFNSFNFDFDRIRRSRRDSCLMVHRVDGPTSKYRGEDDGTDHRVWEINNDIADITVFQSGYSRMAHVEMGLPFKSPTVIGNAVNPALFYPPSQPRETHGQKLKIIASSWSTHPNKGGAIYKWLENHLDWDRFEFTFVGRAETPFKHAKFISAVPSEELGALLRDHDIYLMASVHDACSNGLIEALACGLPTIFVKSGGNPEIVGDAGFGYDSREEIPDLLDRLASQYEERVARISVPTLQEVADAYLKVMHIAC